MEAPPLAKKKGTAKYILQVAIGGAALLILGDIAGVFGQPTGGGPPKYKCSMGSCFQDPAGQYSTIEECLAGCQPYGCEQGQCVLNANGPYNSLADCRLHCGTGAPPHIDVNPTTVAQGNSVVVQGLLFSPNGKVSVCISNGTSTPDCVETTADSSGAFGLQIQIPDDFPVGPQTITAHDAQLNLDSNTISVNITQGTITMPPTGYANCSAPILWQVFKIVTCTDKATYIYGQDSTLKWASSGWRRLLESGGGIVSAFIIGSQYATPSPLPRYQATPDATATASGTIDITALPPGDYVLESNTTADGAILGSGPQINFTIQGPTITGPAQLWLSTSPQGPPVTSVPSGTKLYWSGSGWPYKPNQFGYPNYVYAGIAAQLQTGGALTGSPFGAPVNIDGTLNGVKGIGLYLNPNVWPGPQDLVITGNDPKTGAASPPFTLHVEGPPIPSSGVTLLLITNSWAPSSNGVRIDGVRYTWAPNVPLTLPISLGFHEISTEIGLYSNIRLLGILSEGGISVSGLSFTLTAGAVIVLVYESS